MPLFAPISFPTFVFEDENLPGLSLLYDMSADNGILDYRFADSYIFIICNSW
jgi:hypothetical protein